MERHTKESAIMALSDYRAKLEDCRKRAESSEAREAKLVEAVRPFVVCPCCEGRDSCSESCTYRNDDPYGWGRLTALRSALATVKEGK